MSNIVYRSPFWGLFVVICIMEGHAINNFEQDTIPPKQLEEIIVTPKEGDELFGQFV